MPSLPVLKSREFGLTIVPTFGEPRFDIVGIGEAEQRDPARYDWDNRNRPPGVLFQHTLEGEGRVRDPRGREHRLTAGRAMLVELPSATRYWLPAGPTPRWRFMWAMLNGEGAIDVSRQLIAQHGCVFGLSHQSPPLDTLRRVHTALADGDSPDEWTINVEGHRLLMDLARALAQPAAPLPETVDAALRLIDERYTDPTLGVDELAHVAGYSRFHFSRHFRQHTGQTPYQALMRRRMRAALTMLTQTRRPVKQIATMCGFKDTSWFCAQFKRQIGVTPTEAREQRQHFSADPMFNA